MSTSNRDEVTSNNGTVKGNLSESYTSGRGNAVVESDSPESPTLTREPIPRAERRGLLTTFLLIPELKDPYQYSNLTKWLMTAIVALAATTSSTGSSIFFPALSQVASDFHSSQTLANLSLAFYLLAMAITPLWWSMYSESLGRRTIYLVSFFAFVVLSAISAVSVNMAMLIVFRCLSGGAAASVQAVGAGTIADVWEVKERGRGMGIFFLGPLCGPGIAPVIGGALTEGFGWRSTQWFLTIFGGVQFLLILFLLPETIRRKPSGDRETEKSKAKLTVGDFLKRCVRPVGILALMRHPPILVATYSGALTFAVTYVMYVSIESVFAAPPYDIEGVLLGCLYLAPTIGYAISSVVSGRWIDYIMAREAKKANRFGPDGKLKYLPEDRMKENMWISATLYPAMIIWYGWTAYYGVQWAVPMVAALLYGVFAMLLYGAVTTVLTEFTPRQASSGVALNNFVRSILGTIAIVVTEPLIDAIGVNWTCMLVGLFALVTTLLTLAVLKWKIQDWRVVMDRKLNGDTA